MDASPVYEAEKETFHDWSGKLQQYKKAQHENLKQTISKRNLDPEQKHQSGLQANEATDIPGMPGAVLWDMFSSLAMDKMILGV